MHVGHTSERAVNERIPLHFLDETLRSMSGLSCKFHSCNKRNCVDRCSFSAGLPLQIVDYFTVLNMMFTFFKLLAVIFCKPIITGSIGCPDIIIFQDLSGLISNIL